MKQDHDVFVNFDSSDSKLMWHFEYIYWEERGQCSFYPHDSQICTGNTFQVCPKNTHNLILGCLLDLCENPKTIHHIHTWRGKENCSAAHLFCEIYRNEEKDMGVKRDKDGAISDITKPLMGTLQEYQGVVALPASNPSQSIVDVSENMRAKLYSLFCKIGKFTLYFLHFFLYSLDSNDTKNDISWVF